LRAASPADRSDTIAYFQPLLVPGLVVLAMVLRLWHVRHGLPHFLEEASALRLALAMRGLEGTVDWNPHSFLEPSLTVYLHFAVQQIVYGIGLLGHAWTSVADFRLTFATDPSPMVVAARMVGIVFDALSVVATVRLGRRFGYGAGLLAGLFVAATPGLVLTARSVLAGTAMTCAALWSLERLLAWHDRGRPGRLIAAAALAGLSMGAGYAGAVLLLPLAWLAWRREQAQLARAVQLTAAALGIALLTFVATTPWAVLEATRFVHDAAVGLAGTAVNGGTWTGFGTLSARISHDLGGPIALFVACSIGFVAIGRLRIPALVLWMGLAGFGIAAAVAVNEPSAMVPVLALAGVLGAAAMRAAVEPFRRSVRRLLLAVLLAGAAGPAIASGVIAAWTGSDTTQLAARRWCERFVKPNDVVVQEPFGPQLLSELDAAERRELREYQLPSDELRGRADARRTFRVVTLPLPEPGAITNRLPGGREVPVYEQGAQLHQAFYDPRLYAGVDYVITSGALRRAFERSARSHPVACAFYRLLDTAGDVVARFSPRGAMEGPEVVVYRIGSRYHAALEAYGELDSLWWTRTVPRGYRALATRVLEPRAAAAAAAVAAWDSSAGTRAVVASSGPAHTDSVVVPSLDPVAAPRDSSGALPPPSAWVTSLLPVYDAQLRPFIDGMMTALARSSRPAAARRFALAALMLHPDDEQACRIYSATSRAGGELVEARAALERILDPASPRPADPALRLEYAQVLQALGDLEGARAELDALSRISDPANPVAAEARRLLAATP